MTKSGPAFVADDYVVRYGMRGFLVALLGLAVWTVLAVVVLAARPAFPSLPAAVALAIGELGLLLACGLELHRAARREVLFAVHSDGVYLGSGPVKEDVPWERISAVELFTEGGPGRGSRGSRRCVGVRARGTELRASGMRAGATGGARNKSGQSKDGRTNTGPARGAETTWLTYRRMIGWRADPARLTESVRCYAPSVAVLDGTARPPSPTRARPRHPSS